MHPSGLNISCQAFLLGCVAKNDTAYVVVAVLVLACSLVASMFGRSYASQHDVGNLLPRVVGLDDALMTALPRVGGLEMQHTKTNQKHSVLESRLDGELQRRRSQLDFEGSAAGTQASQKPAAGAQPLPSHRGVGAVP